MKTLSTRATFYLRTSASLWGGVPPRNANFTGRDDILGELDRYLHRSSQTEARAMLFGLGGAGKTHVAIEYVYRTQAEYELIWWIPAGDEKSIRGSLGSLAKRLNIPAERVLDELRLGAPYARWLLVFDNAGDAPSLQKFLPRGPGHTIITSRNRDWAAVGSAMSVDVFEPEESEAFLGQSWPALTRERALELAEGVGHHPLALRLAVAMHHDTATSSEEFLRLLASAPSQLLEGVAGAWRLALNELEPGATQLLELLAFLGPEPISIQMLQRSWSGDDIAFRRAIREMGRLALAQLNSGTGQIMVHRLVQAVVRDALPAKSRAVTRRAAHAALADANPGDPDNPDRWRQHAEITPHVAASGIVHADGNEERQVVLDQIRYLYSIGDYAASRDMCKSAVVDWKTRFGPDDEMTLLAGRYLANALRALGEREAAMNASRDTWERMRRSLGENHEHTLAGANGLGADLRLLGKYREAQGLDTDNLDRSRRVLGENDPATLRAANSLALDERLLGNFQLSSAMQQKIIAQCAIVLGEEHPFTLFCKSNLAADLRELGEYQEGLALLREALPALERKLGSRHAWVLQANRQYAVLLRETGNIASSLQTASQNNTDCLRFLGAEHHLTLASAVTLANVLRANGDSATAKHLLGGALETARDGFGDEHPFTLACANSVELLPV